VAEAASSTYFFGSISSQLEQHSLTELHPIALVPFPLKTSETAAGSSRHQAF